MTFQQRSDVEEQCRRLRKAGDKEMAQSLEAVLEDALTVRVGRQFQAERNDLIAVADRLVDAERAIVARLGVVPDGSDESVFLLVLRKTLRPGGRW